MLNKNQIKQIVTFLKKENQLTDQSILEEMTDHFCCLVEKKMITGDSFEEAFSTVSGKITQEDTETIQRHAKKLQFGIRLRRKFRSISAVAAMLILLMVIGADAQIKPDLPPIKGDMKITAQYGKGFDPVKKKERFHYGIDIRAKVGTPIYATADGTVNEASFSDQGYGNKIILSHGGDYKTLYAHLSTIIVKEGERVKKGELIGYSGNSGWSTGPHLHYEVLEKGARKNPQLFIETEDE